MGHGAAVEAEAALRRLRYHHTDSGTAAGQARGCDSRAAVDKGMVTDHDRMRGTGRRVLEIRHATAVRTRELATLLASEGAPGRMARETLLVDRGPAKDPCRMRGTAMAVQERRPGVDTAAVVQARLLGG